MDPAGSGDLLHRSVLPRPYWKRGPTQQDGECVYYLSPDRKRLVRVIEDMKQPNGIIGTPDGTTLYVADIGAAEPTPTISGPMESCSTGGCFVGWARTA